MIHSARPTVLPEVITILAGKLICFILKSEDRRKDLCTDNTCENGDHYRPWLWVGPVDQKVKYAFRKIINHWYLLKILNKWL